MIIPSEKNSPAMQRILALLARKADMSASDMSREAFVGMTTLACGGYLKALRARGLVHVSGWRKTRKGFVTPLFSLGNRPDLPRPKFEDEDRDSPGMKLILAALERHGMLTYLEAAQTTGLSPNTLKNARYMDILVKQERIHIAAWRRNHAGPMIAVYAAGQGRPAPKPTALSRAESCRRCREKKRVFSQDRGITAQLARLQEAISLAQ
jgi:lambda repressor-like predicted transcriptional regulator